MTKGTKEETIVEVKANLEHQLSKLDTMVEKAVQKVDKLTIKRNGVAQLLEKVNRLGGETSMAG